MILQIDSRFDSEPDIQKYGCHYLSLLFLINRCGNVPLSVGIITATFHLLSTQRASYQPDEHVVTYVIGAQCAMNNPDDIVAQFDMKSVATCRFEGADYICKTGEQELLQFTRPMDGEPGKSWWHWVAGDGKGNVAYDPEGYSLTVRDGTLARKKIFSIIHRGVNA